MKLTNVQISHRLFSTTELFCLRSIKATTHAVPGLESIHSFSLSMQYTEATRRKYVLRVSNGSFTKLTDIFKIADTGKRRREMNLWTRVGSHGARAKHWGTWKTMKAKNIFACIATYGRNTFLKFSIQMDCIPFLIKTYYMQLYLLGHPQGESLSPLPGSHLTLNTKNQR